MQIRCTNQGGIVLPHGVAEKAFPSGKIDGNATFEITKAEADVLRNNHAHLFESGLLELVIDEAKPPRAPKPETSEPPRAPKPETSEPPKE